MSAAEVDVQNWADRIKATMASSIEAILATGRELLACKAAVGHGNYLKAIEQAGMSRSSAHQFTSIALNSALSNVQRVGHLPADRGALAVLAGVPAEKLETAIETGTVSSGMSRTKASSFVRALKHAERVKEIAEQDPVPLDELAVFQVLYADPPWQYEVKDRHGAAANHYPTMSDAELSALTVPAADDCVLFMWATSPKLVSALQVVESWGFQYKAHFVWDKCMPGEQGMGSYVKVQHELLLITLKGNPGAPEPGNQPSSVVSLPRPGGHSVKPNEFYDLIERMYPLETKLEMFARRSRPGWASWGNQAPQECAA